MAHAEDGVVEAVETLGPDWVVGVQWHAECMDAPEQRALFDAFVDAAAVRAVGPEGRDLMAA